MDEVPMQAQTATASKLNRLTEVSREMNMLREIVSNNIDLVSQLREKLAPVLSQRPTPHEGADKNLNPTCTQLGSAIHDISGALLGQAKEINDILECLEI